MPRPEDPGRSSSISPKRGCCVGLRCVKTVAVCFIALTRLYQTLWDVRVPVAYMVPCVRLYDLSVFCTSYTYATLGMSGW